MQNGCFALKSALVSKAVCFKVFFCVNTVNDKVERHSPPCVTVQKMVAGKCPILWENLPKPTHLHSKNVDFRSIFAGSASGVTPTKVQLIPI